MNVKRNALAIGAVVVVGAGAAGALSTTATAATAAAAHRVVFHLDGRTAHRSYFGRHPGDPRPGDRLTEFASLKRHGKVVGRFMNACSIVVGGAKANDDICDGVIEVGRSQIVLGGSGNPDVVPIVGGSGAYAYIAGTVKETSTHTGAALTVVYRNAS